MNFLQLGWLDFFDLAASLRTKLHLFPEPDADGCRILDLRWLDANDVWRAHAETKKWVELKNTLSRIRRIGAGTDIETGRIWLEMLDVGALIPWHSTVGEYSRLYCAVRTNPAVMQFNGLEQRHLLPGTLTLVSPNQMASACNLGEWQAIHLVIEIRKRIEAPSHTHDDAVPATA